MSISTLENSQKRLLREIERLHGKISRYSRLRMKSDLSNLMKAQQDLAKKNKSLNDIERRLSKERVAQAQKDKREENRQIKDLRRLQQQKRELIKSGIKVQEDYSREFDVFVSYVHSDSDDYVEKLVLEMKNAGLNVWWDKEQMRTGASMRGAMDVGLARSKVSLNVFSPAYLEKYWTSYEVDGSLTKESITGEQMMLPIWHNVTADEIASKSPTLASRLAWNSAINTNKEIAEQLVEMLRQ